MSSVPETTELPCGTKFPHLFSLLSADFDPGDVKLLPKGGRQIKYVTARTVMNRLDDVLGPENWSDEYLPRDKSVVCKLTIILPDGRTVTKADAGGFAGMSDAGDDEKSGFCLPLNAEALTLDGWREYHQLDVGAIILAYDPADGVCKWTSVRHITVFDEPCSVVRLASKSFDMICTPNHRWVVNRRDKGIMVKQTKDLDTLDKIINAAPAVGGEHPLTPREASILGWLATDGSINRGSRASEGRTDRQFHATIHQSKEPYRTQIRELLGDDATEHITPPGERTFPGHAVASLTRARSMFRLKNGFARELLAKAGIEEWSDIIGLIPRLTIAAREAMFEAMLDGDGQHSCSGQIVFGKKAKPGVMEAFEILATLQGVALGAQRFSTVGEVPIRTLRKLDHVHAKGIEITPSRSIPVWCPTTAFGTWVTRWNGCITITGNSDAFKRTAAKFGIGRYLYRDGMAQFHDQGGEVIETPHHRQAEHREPPRQQQQQQQRQPDRQPSNGGGTGNVPRSGKALFAWTKDMEQRHEIGLLKYINAWSKSQDFPGRMVDWDGEQVALAYNEAVRKIRSVSPQPQHAANGNGHVRHDDAVEDVRANIRREYGGGADDDMNGV